MRAKLALQQLRRVTRIALVCFDEPIKIVDPSVASIDVLIEREVDEHGACSPDDIGVSVESGMDNDISGRRAEATVVAHFATCPAYQHRSIRFRVMVPFERAPWLNGGGLIPRLQQWHEAEPNRAKSHPLVAVRPQLALANSYSSDDPNVASGPPLAPLGLFEVSVSRDKRSLELQRCNTNARKYLLPVFFLIRLLLSWYTV